MRRWLEVRLDGGVRAMRKVIFGVFVCIISVFLLTSLAQGANQTTISIQDPGTSDGNSNTDDAGTNRNLYKFQASTAIGTAGNNATANGGPQWQHTSATGAYMQSGNVSVLSHLSVVKSVALNTSTPNLHISKAVDWKNPRVVYGSMQDGIPVGNEFYNYLYSIGINPSRPINPNDRKAVVTHNFLGEISNVRRACKVTSVTPTSDGVVLAYNASANQLDISMERATYNYSSGNTGGKMFGSSTDTSWDLSMRLLLFYEPDDLGNLIPFLDPTSQVTVYRDNQEYILYLDPDSLQWGSLYGVAGGDEVDPNPYAFTGIVVSAMPGTFDAGGPNDLLRNEYFLDGMQFGLAVPDVSQPIDLVSGGVPLLTDFQVCATGNQLTEVPEIPLAVLPVIVTVGAGFFIWKKRHAKKQSFQGTDL